MNVDLAIGPLGSAQDLFGSPGHRRRPVENPHDGRALRSPVAGSPPEDVVGGDAALAVRRAGQRHLGRLAGHEVLNFDGVSDRVDIRVAGLQVLVDPDAAARPDFQARIDGQLVLRPHPDPQDDQLGRQAHARLQPHRQAIGRLLECLGGLTEQQRDALGSPGVRQWASSSPCRTAAAPGPATRPPWSRCPGERGSRPVRGR